MRYQVLLEHDRENGHWTATVAGVPHIIVDANTQAEAVRRVEDAIRFAREEGELPADASVGQIQVRVVSVYV